MPTASIVLIDTARFRARQALLAYPQRVMTHEYLQRKEEEQRPWW